MLLFLRLKEQRMGRGSEHRQRALTQKQTLRRWLECPSSLLERLQRRVAFEALGERSSSFCAEIVVRETVRKGWNGDGEKAGVSAGADT